MHTLDTGNTLLTVAIPAEKEALIYYELANLWLRGIRKGKGTKACTRARQCYWQLKARR